MNSCSNSAQHSALLAIVRSRSSQRILCRDRSTLSRALCFVLHAPSVLSHALCLIVTSLSLAHCMFPIATLMNSIVTCDVLTMTELCRDLKFPCRDLVSTTYTPLCRDKEKSCHDIKFLVTFVLCRDMRFSFTPVLCCDLKAYVAIEKSSHLDNLYCDTESPITTLNLLLPPCSVTTWNRLTNNPFCRDIESPSVRPGKILIF